VLEKEQKIQSIELIPESDQAGFAVTSEEEKPESSDPLEVLKPAALPDDTKEGVTASLGELSRMEDSGRIDELIARQLDTVHAMVVAMENEKEVVSDAQIDSLLLEAQRFIAAQDTTGDQSSVDPSILLAQAEDELDQTFREQILETLKTEYTRIRNSVAARNK